MHIKIRTYLLTHIWECKFAYAYKDTHTHICADPINPATDKTTRGNIFSLFTHTTLGVM